MSSKSYAYYKKKLHKNSFFFALTLLCFNNSHANEEKSVPPVRLEAELIKLAKPIALYPDVLVKNILPASTFPDQIIDASLLIKNKNDANQIKDQNWDKSVKIIATYPGVLKMMSDSIEWTTDLGEAFMYQSKELLDAIQDIRSGAKANGSLKSDSKQKVKVDENQGSGNTVIIIEPSDPEVVYIPQDTVVVSDGTYTNNSTLVPIATFGLGMALGAAMADDDDNYYYSGWGGSNFWYDQSPANHWLDNRREAWEDHNDRAWDRQDFRQDQKADRQDFRQDNYNKSNMPSKSQMQDFRNKQTAERKDFAKNHFPETKTTATQRLEARRSANNSSLSSARSNSAFQNYGSRSQTSSYGSRGMYSRSASGGGMAGRGFGGGGMSGGRSFGGGGRGGGRR